MRPRGGSMTPAGGGGAAGSEVATLVDCGHGQATIAGRSRWAVGAAARVDAAADEGAVAGAALAVGCVACEHANTVNAPSARADRSAGIRIRLCGIAGPEI